MDDKIIKELSLKMQESSNWLKEELLKISVGRPSPTIFDKVMVDYYEIPTPLNQTAQIAIPDATTIIITPYDRTVIKNIIEAIQAANLGFNPQDEGDKVRINIPAVTAERREEMAKSLGAFEEKAKIKIRSERQEAMKLIQSDKEASEDFVKFIEKEIQEITDKFTKEIEQITENKKNDLKKI